MASISASPPEDGSVKKEDLEFIHLEEQELAHRSPGNGSSVYSIDEAHQKRVIRRVDLRLLPILGIMYSISLIDRTNLGLAFVAGMEQDLGLDIGNRYTVVVMVFFVAYIFEVGKRLATFWLVSVVLNAFAAIFAYALTLLDGSYGLNGWRWIFIVEGAITSGICLLGWFIIIDFPTQADTFLKPEEKEFIIARINNDSGDAEEDPITMERILHHLKDWKLCVWAFNLMASTLPGYAYSYFKTVILMGMGFSNTQSQLLSAPPYIIAAFFTYLGGWLTDKYQIRGPVIAVHQLLTAVGVGFLQFCIPGVLAFQANNITSHSKRGVASATCLIGGGLGGIIASVTFKSDESPHYTTGIWVTFGITMVSICLTLIMDFHFWKTNKKARETNGQIEGMSGWYYTL
ncbi:Major facilitator superfamily domain, general substrate transporter [Penicillium expansum]|uniref:Major facilitator superfamily domain, general substrate transporter n=1 Tax=Penicillium expansum TaxID=27334 RepID=A0A0A2K6Q3_PENEN|nr:Major facilitator superfamily domain, general substrate transporter [Penicillium expansum]KGO44234.1 Major facilitator superfamily domain, general substrate transporter [Penicillium expansum]KGO60060.1 Major facilitator superfamily domain, general substrate transporter [Penicillium expansum]KGO67763.1 Major facilitator superfamily domain, general substrate transporter [Penicillium expansum]